MREKQIEKKLRMGIEGKGGFAMKFVSPQNSGVPDRLILLPDGKALFVEVKAPGKKPDPLQDIQIAKIRKLGFQVEVISSNELLKKFLDAL